MWNAQSELVGLPSLPRSLLSPLLQLVHTSPHPHHHLVVIVIVGVAPLLIPPPAPPSFKWRYYSAVIEDTDGDMDTGGLDMVQLNVHGRIIIC